MDVELLIKNVLDSAHAVHRVLKPGLMELLYKRALVVEIQSRGISCEIEKDVPAFYRGQNIGTLKADIVVENCLILELKAISDLTDANRTQLVTYLTLSGIEDGLLINFGSPLLQIERKWRTYNRNRNRNRSAEGQKEQKLY